MTKIRVREYEHGIVALDSGYERVDLDAIHLIFEGQRVAIVDTGTNFSVPLVLAALAHYGRGPNDVDYVILTHIHLDHAGGAGELMRACPAARLTVHPRGARHMADPAKLWEGTVAVYGEQTATKIYGRIAPIPAERIIETSDEHVIEWGTRSLRFFDTPGHAKHHVMMHDSRSGHLFVGDTFGISYTELDQDGRSFVIPTTSPTHFEPEPYHRSIDLVLRLAPPAVYMTHYAQRRDIAHIGERMHALVDECASAAIRYRDAGPDRPRLLEEAMRNIVLAEAHRQRLRHDDATVARLYALDIGLNAQGLGVYADSTRKRA